MDHRRAVQTSASERYLLGEMAERERLEFEEHYFSCVECAEDIRAGDAFVRGVKAVLKAPLPFADPAHKPVRRGWFTWLSTPSLIPVAAAVVLAAIAAYQWLVLIPSLRNATSTRALSPVVLRAAVRDQAPVLRVPRSAGFTVLAMDVITPPPPGSSMIYELVSEDRTRRITGKTEPPPPGSLLLLAVRNEDIARPGAWTLLLRAPDGTEAGQYPFTVDMR